VNNIFKKHILVYISYTRNKLSWRHKNGVYFYSSKNLEFLLKVQWIFAIFTQPFFMTNLRGTCLSTELKGYIVRERLGTPVVEGVYI